MLYASFRSLRLRGQLGGGVGGHVLSDQRRVPAVHQRALPHLLVPHVRQLGGDPQSLPERQVGAAVVMAPT